MQLCYRGVYYEVIPSSRQSTQSQLVETAPIFLQYRGYHYLLKPYVGVQPVGASNPSQNVTVVQQRLVYRGVVYMLKQPKMTSLLYSFSSFS